MSATPPPLRLHRYKRKKKAAMDRLPWLTTGTLLLQTDPSLLGRDEVIHRPPEATDRPPMYYI